MDTKKLNTEPFKNWPSGDYKPVIQVQRTSETLEKVYGLCFTREKDDLDWSRAAHFIDEMIGPVVLNQYENSPTTGIDIYVDKNVPNNIAIERIKKILEFNESEISWKANSE